MYEIARREALGSIREDRFKGRVISPPISTVTAAAGEDKESFFDGSLVVGVATPSSVPPSSGPPGMGSGPGGGTEAEVTETPSGRIMKRPGGGIMMQRHGSETMLEFPAVVGPAALGGSPCEESADARASYGGDEAGHGQHPRLELGGLGGGRGIGQALRLSSSLQRSTKGGSLTMSEVVKPGTSGRS